MNLEESFQLLIPNPDNIHWIGQKNWQISQKQGNLPQSSELKQVIELCAKQWSIEKQRKDYLLRGKSLIVAEKFYLSYGQLLSLEARKYIISCLADRDRASLPTKWYYQLIVPVIATISIISLSALSIAPSNLTLESNTVPTPNLLDRIEFSNFSQK